MCARFSNRLPAPRWNVTRVHAWLWQGGGVYVYTGGKATLTNSNVYQNEANDVRSPFEPSSSANTKVYQNSANIVRSLVLILHDVYYTT